MCWGVSWWVKSGKRVWLWRSLWVRWRAQKVVKGMEIAKRIKEMMSNESLRVKDLWGSQEGFWCWWELWGYYKEPNGEVEEECSSHLSLHIPNIKFKCEFEFLLENSSVIIWIAWISMQTAIQTVSCGFFYVLTFPICFSVHVECLMFWFWFQKYCELGLEIYQNPNCFKVLRVFTIHQSSITVLCLSNMYSLLISCRLNFKKYI